MSSSNTAGHDTETTQRPNEAAGRTPAEVRHIQEVVDIRALKVVEKAKAGDPSALREILDVSRKFLDGSAEIPGSYAVVLSEFLGKLLGNEELWDALEDEFEELDKSEHSFEEVIFWRGPRVSENAQRKLGRAFCRSFAVSKPQGRIQAGNVPEKRRHARVVCPTAIHQCEMLIRHGVSWRKSIEVTHRTWPGMSKNEVERWLRVLKTRFPVKGTLGYGEFIENCMRVANVVSRSLAEGDSQGEAIRKGALRIATWVFPIHREALMHWASNVLERAELESPPPENQVEFADSIVKAFEQGDSPPLIPNGLLDEIAADLKRLNASTRVPEEALPLLFPAVKKSLRIIDDLRQEASG